MGEGVAVGPAFCASAQVLNPASTSKEAANAAMEKLRINTVDRSMPAPFSLFHLSLHDDSAVGMQNRSGVVTTLFAGEEQGGVGDIDRLAHPIHRHALHQGR